MRHRRTLRALVGILVATGISAGARPAHAGWWTQSEAEPTEPPRVHFGPAMMSWFGTFTRTERSCDQEILTPGPPTRQAQFGCGGSSDEVGAGIGARVTVRIVGPLHLAVGLDLLNTFPTNGLLSQLIVAVPMSLLVTFPDWRVRPVVELTVLPFVSIRDVAHDFTLGAEGGLAVDVGPGTLEIIGGFQSATKTQVGVFRLGYLFATD
ncbi:MAG: hypothetical protein U1E65_00520 [Myxococcota bacterium]